MVTFVTWYCTTFLSPSAAVHYYITTPRLRWLGRPGRTLRCEAALPDGRGLPKRKVDERGQAGRGQVGDRVSVLGDGAHRPAGPHARRAAKIVSCVVETGRLAEGGIKRPPEGKSAHTPTTCPRQTNALPRNRRRPCAAAARSRGRAHPPRRPPRRSASWLRSRAGRARC